MKLTRLKTFIRAGSQLYIVSLRHLGIPSHLLSPMYTLTHVRAYTHAFSITILLITTHNFCFTAHLKTLSQRTSLPLSLSSFVPRLRRICEKCFLFVECPSRLILHLLLGYNLPAALSISFASLSLFDLYSCKTCTDDWEY